MRCALVLAAFGLMLGSETQEGTKGKEGQPSAKQAMILPPAKARELQTAYEAALQANHAYQLAQKEWEAKYNAWVAIEYKVRYELRVPPDYVLNLETGAFEPKTEADLGTKKPDPIAPPKQKQGP